MKSMPNTALRSLFFWNTMVRLSSIHCLTFWGCMWPYLEGSDVQWTFSNELLTPAGVVNIQSKTMDNSLSAMENNPRRTKTSTAPLQQSANLQSATFTDNQPTLSITQFYTAPFLVLTTCLCLAVFSIPGLAFIQPTPLHNNIPLA